MTNAELIAKIKAEIERRKSLLTQHSKLTYDLILETFIKEYDDLLSFLDTLESEKPVTNDLEEAAEISFDEAYALTEDYMDFLAKGLTENRPRPIGPHWFCEYAKNRFIAGAKWQKQHDAELIEIAYNDGITIGMTKQKEQIMKGAVEGEYDFYPAAVYLDVPIPKMNHGDKVRIVIVKEG